MGSKERSQCQSLNDEVAQGWKERRREEGEGKRVVGQSRCDRKQVEEEEKEEEHKILKKV